MGAPTFTIATIDDRRYVIMYDEEDFALPPMAEGGEGVDGMPLNFFSIFLRHI
jgi:hypothetical protein